MESLNKRITFDDDYISIKSDKGKKKFSNLENLLIQNNKKKNSVNEKSRERIMEKAMNNLNDLTIVNNEKEKLGVKSANEFAKIERSFILSMRELVSNN